MTKLRERLAGLRPGDRDAARALWDATAPGIGAAILGSIRKMGLPSVSVGPLGAGLRERFTSTRHCEVRRTLLCDTAMHADIQQEVATQLFAAAERGTLPPDATAGYVFTIVQRTTWRHATARARHLLSSVEAANQTEAVDLVASPGHSEERICARLEVGRLAELVDKLDVSEKRLLVAKLDDAYEELALELGVEVGVLRVRAHRLCKRLLLSLRGEPDTGDR